MGGVLAGWPDLMTPAEVAAAFRVKTSTVARWRRAGRLSCVRLPGGRDCRYFRSEVEGWRLAGDTARVPDGFEECGSEDDWDYELCEHECDEECSDEGDLGCMHQHCWNCGGCRCPGYCDDEQTYNLRFAETGGSDPVDTVAVAGGLL